MGGQPKLEPRCTDRINISIIQILLPQMHPVAFQLDSKLPIIVDHQKTIMFLTDRFGLKDLGTDHILGLILDPQLHQLDAQGYEPLNPTHIVKDRVERR